MPNLTPLLGLSVLLVVFITLSLASILLATLFINPLWWSYEYVYNQFLPILKIVFTFLNLSRSCPQRLVGLFMLVLVTPGVCEYGALLTSEPMRPAQIQKAGTIKNKSKQAVI